MDASRLRRAYLDFFVQRGHAAIARANLVPREDPTTLFTGSGMQPLLPFLLGATHPDGQRLVDSQLCFRSEDIDEVGDARHTTLFEMLGNWSLGDYFKDEQLPWLFEFLTTVLELDPTRLVTTVFSGAARWGIERDDRSIAIWSKLFESVGLEPVLAEPVTAERAAAEGIGSARIVSYDESHCWWSRSGPPDAMPPGEPGGPDSEVFYLFPQIPHDPSFGAHCHPHCDCGRYVEIGNSVFMQYLRTETGFEELPRPNVDFGGGLERLAMASEDLPDVFDVDLLAPLVERIGAMAPSSGGKSERDTDRALRIIADHTRAVVFLALDGVEPSNNTQGYVMRRFARRALRQGLHLGIESGLLSGLVETVVQSYGNDYPDLATRSGEIATVLEQEERLFRRTLSRGVRELPRLAGSLLTGQAIFTLFDTYGFPPELSLEEAESAAIAIDPDWRGRYDELMAEQRERSKTAAAGMFKGGLADSSEATTRLHTATHLMYKALRLVLGDHVVQRGSNITPERLRFDFSHPEKVTPEELARVEEIVNENIARDWPMIVKEMPPEQAFANGALGAFGDKYGDLVTVYTAGDPNGEWYSKEICGGPHVTHTGELGRFRIVKEESSSAGVRRIRAVLEAPAPAA
ncbi:MAG TPA: alanine--tRNA ligase-related protein [Acidimicrobiales bacterium]|nr:alanine--tRNA ligase-related protein [Acidimicrobiales bacterium]